MNYWIFKCNPEQYRIDDRLLDPDPNITWSVTRYSDLIKSGDIAFIWRAGIPRGICGIMEINSSPFQMIDYKEERKYSVTPNLKSRLYVEAKLTHRFPLIESQRLKQENGLENLSVFHGFQQATNFEVTAQEAEVLLGLALG